MLEKVLIANRGVAAVRIARTLRGLGIPYVVVHSDADAELPFVKEAAEAIRIGAARADETYLRGDAIIAAMRQSGADSVHPGYGFLSENASFAREVRAAGLTFIGPSPEHIAALGDKVASRQWMSRKRFPVLPASAALPATGDLAPIAAKIGYPLLIKASAGGGGGGMQRVASEAEFSAMVVRAREVAARLFGDDTIYVEKQLDEARHVEFQILSDGRGEALWLGHRDCSVQRRHQKVIEEAPIPFVDGDGAHELGGRLARLFGEYGYQSLATVEMLMDRSGGFFFLEVNTRLQVEHGVTEAITGLDLVELQIGVANGRPLSELLPAPPPFQGHAIEARIYAEDPVRFLPSPGQLSVFRPPLPRDWLMVDAGYVEGNTVTPFYDPMIAIVVARGADREDAVSRLDRALAEFEVEGVRTNIPFLRRMLSSEEFRDGAHHTAFAEPFAKEGSRAGSAAGSTV